MVNPQVTKEKVGGNGTGTGAAAGTGTCSLDPTDGKQCRRCSNHPEPPKNNKGKCSTGSAGNSSRKNSANCGGCEDGKCTVPVPPTGTGTGTATAATTTGNSKPGKWKKKETEEDECVVEKPTNQKTKIKEKLMGEGKGNGNKKTQTTTTNKTQNEPTCATQDEGGFIPINQPFIFAMNPVTLKYKAILLDAQQLDSVSKARFNTLPSEAGTSAPVTSKKSRAFIPPGHASQAQPQKTKSVSEPPGKCIPLPHSTKSVGITTSSLAQSANQNPSESGKSAAAVPTTYTATYNPPQADDGHNNPNRKFGRNIYESSAPALILPSSKNVANSGACTFNSIKRSSLQSKTTGRKDPSEITDPIEAAFYNLTLTYHPLLWVFGYSHDNEIAEHRRRCLESLAERNNLYIIDLDREIRRFEDATVRRTSASIAQSININTSKTASGATPVSVKDMNDLIVVRAKALVRKVTIEKQPLSTQEICQLIKYIMLSVVHDDGSGAGSGIGQSQSQGYHSVTRNSGQVSGYETKGFIIDGFPLTASEGVDAESILYKATVCLYFEGREWSTNKTVEPKIVKPKYHLRRAPYSEKEVEAAADFFGFKTIKVLNTEDLKDVQIEDIATLVHTHLEGRGLALHKIITKDPKNPTGGAIKNQGTSTNKGNTLGSGGVVSGQAVGETSTNYVLDHQNFVNAANPDPNRTVGKKTAILQTAGIKGPPPPLPPKPILDPNLQRVEQVKFNQPTAGQGQGNPGEANPKPNQNPVTDNQGTKETKSGLTTTTEYTSASGSGSVSASGYFTETGGSATANPSGNNPPQSTGGKSKKSSKSSRA